MMMKKTLAVALLFAAAPAFAGSVDMTGFYAGATLGTGSASFSAPAGSALIVEKANNKPVYGVFGGYHYNKNLAVELAYSGASYFYTTNPATGAKYLSKQIAFSVAAVGTYPVSDAFSVFGKLGVANTSSENNAVAEQNTNRFAPTFGVGAEYKFTPNISGRLGVDVYSVAATIPTTLVKQNSTATVVNAGVSYSF
ncbi:MAG TPA: outer membrane beta-barrel protein [Gallionella sp.]|nr:outer membrane beta-barrel protein [Gallionella sp.]